MIKGLYISEDGMVQVIGDVRTFQTIIKAMINIIPQLQAQENQRLAQELDDEAIHAILKARAEKQNNTINLAEAA